MSAIVKGCRTPAVDGWWRRLASAGRDRTSLGGGNQGGIRRVGPDRVDAGGGWTDGGVAGGYHTYTQGLATLLVDTDVSVNAGITA